MCLCGKEAEFSKPRRHREHRDCTEKNLDTLDTPFKSHESFARVSKAEIEHETLPPM
jgi:hypothetical protein